MNINYIKYIIIFIISSNSLQCQSIENISTSRPFSVAGSIGLNLNSYSSSGIEARSRPFDYSLLGNLNIAIYGISVPLSAVYSEQDRSYTQPFNHYGISPSYKWITLHLGWRNINFSPYTLSGQTFLGGGLEITPGILRFAVIYGRFNKAASGDSASNLLYPPTYERLGYSFKLGLGSNSTYVDFILLRAWDKLNSLDSINQNTTKPQENLVLGIASKIQLLKELRFELDASASLYTIDMRSNALLDSANTKILANFSSIFNLKLSTQLTTALQSALVYSGKLFSAKISYKRIEPDYKSMGIYYTESDVENYTASFVLPLFKRQFKLGGSIGFQKDNLMNTKLNTSNRVIGSANISYNTSNYGADFSFASYGITQTPGINPVIDSLKIAKVNQNFNLTLRYTFSNNSQIENIILNSSYQSLTDLNTITQNNSNNLSINGTFQLSNAQTGINYGITLNAVNATWSNSSNTFLGPILNFSLPINKININTSLGYQHSWINSQSSGGVITTGLSVIYQIEQHQNIKCDGNLIISNTNNSNNFNELRLSLGYIYNF